MVRTNAQGEFSLPLPPGRYYLLARLRTDGKVNLGPLHRGDLLGYDPANPVTVIKGTQTSTAIPMTRLVMAKSLDESSYSHAGVIEGRIVDRNGRPVEGAYAALYMNEKMIGRPDFRSEPTGPDGSFRMYVPVPGRFYLGARSGYGGAPPVGGWSGSWSGSADHAIIIRPEEVRSAVEIVVDRVTELKKPKR